MNGNEHLGLDVGQANELKLAFRRYDWDSELIKRLCERNVDVLGDALDILRGDVKVVPINRVVDLSAAPVAQKGYRVVKHLKQGRKPLHKVRLALMDPRDLQYDDCRDPSFYTGPNRPTGLDLKTLMPRFLRGQRPANICMRDFYLENPHLIPREWNWGGQPVLFWGTLFDFEGGGDGCVPGMSRQFGKWGKYLRRVTLRGNAASLETYDNPCAVFAPAPAY